MPLTKKRAIPNATRRAVAEAHGVTRGTDSEVPCHYCGAIGRIHWFDTYTGRGFGWVAVSGLEFDHVIPESRGGLGTPDNVVLACRPCNRSKKDRTPDEWRAVS